MKFWLLDKIVKFGTEMEPYVPPALYNPVGNYIKGKRYRHKDFGEIWDRVGQLQFEFLTERGLQPHHKFLDVGCGSLRGGWRFIKYLEDGNYYGVDKRWDRVEKGLEVTLPAYGLADSNPNLLVMGNFEFGEFETEFD